MTANEYAIHFAEVPRVSDRRSLLHGRFGSALAFLAPALQFVQFHVIGTLYATDLLSLAVVIFSVIPNAQLLNRRLPRRLLGFGLLWLVAQVTTDLFRATPFDDYARGWAMIAFALVNFAALYLLLYQNRRRIVFCAVGFVAGGILTYIFSPNGFAGAYPWKFGYGYPVTLFVVLVVVLLNQSQTRMLAVTLMMFAAALNLYEGFRSLSGECFLTAAFLIMQAAARSRREQELRVSFAGSMAGFALLALAGAGFVHIYEHFAGNGMLGAAAQEKYEVESSGRYGILVGGRTEFVVGLEAALNSPLIGHGSWAKDWRYSSRLEGFRDDSGYGAVGPADSWLIPTHSYLMGAWVCAGILGLPFWLWVLSLPVRGLGRLYSIAEPLTPLIAFLAIGLIWDVLFSPFGAAQRFSMSFAVVTLIWLLESYPLRGESIA